MATYAIGDIQGCFTVWQRLLKKINFQPGQDTLWLTGDLVNRGPDSLAVLRLARSLGEHCQVVLGNHDLHLLAMAHQITTPRAADTLEAILTAPDRDELLAWLQNRPLLYRSGSYAMIHAGLLPMWTIQQAEAIAFDAHTILSSQKAGALLQAIVHRSSSTSATNPLSQIAYHVRVFTNLRVCNNQGVMHEHFNSTPNLCPEGFFPWYAMANRLSYDTTLICGHWAALGLYLEDNIRALDTGCVWGQYLTAYRLEDGCIFQEPGIRSTKKREP